MEHRNNKTAQQNTGAWLIAFSTEYLKSNDPLKPNQVISYHYYVISPDQEAWNGNIFPEPGKRIELDDLLREAIQGQAKERYLKWPKTIYLIGYSTLKSLCHLSDFKKFKNDLQYHDGQLVTLKDPMKRPLWHNYNRHDAKIFLYDISLLVPDKFAFADIAAMLGYTRFDYSENSPLKSYFENPSFWGTSDYNQYQLSKVEIICQYFKQYMTLHNDLLPDHKPSATIPKISELFTLHQWKLSGIDQNHVRGIAKPKKVNFRFKARYKFPVKSECIPILSTSHELAKRCYVGARVEAFMFGGTPIDNWSDYDLKGAYPTAMLLVPHIDWASHQHSQNITDYKPDVPGYALLKYFKFPPGTRYPCIPVKQNDCLIFPLNGEYVPCTSPEIDLAIRMGAELEIMDGYIFSGKQSEHSPFEQVVLELTKRRYAAPKGSIINEFYKAILTNLYGKVGQGYSDDGIGTSRISSSYFAAYTTSLVRACVTEIMWSLSQQGCLISNVNTDGFAVNAIATQVDIACPGIVSKLLSEIRRLIFNDPRIIEVKHRAKQLLTWRNRGYATAEYDGNEFLLAKSHMKPHGVDGERVLNDWFIEKFINREYGSKYPQLKTNAYDVWAHGCGYSETVEQVALNMDYDFKQRPVSPSISSIKGNEHLFFGTTPWHNINDWERCRDDWAAFSRARKAVLKSVDIANDFLEYHDQYPITAHGINRNIEHPWKTVIHQFLCAYQQGLLGPVKTLTASELVARICKAGYIITRDDVHNAKRMKFIAHGFRDTERVRHHIEKLQVVFSELDFSEMLQKEAGNGNDQEIKV